jgi:hypothetical protein
MTEGPIVTLVFVNAELTVTVTLAQDTAAGAPVLLSFTLTENELVDVRAPVENEGLFCPLIGVAHVSPLYH